MNVVKSVITFALIGFTAFRCAQAIWYRRDTYRLIPGLRPRHVGWALLALCAVIPTAFALAQVPVLSWGWWSLLGGSGSLALGEADATASGPARFIPVALVLLVFAALPPFAYLEEVTFRAGSEARTWPTRIAHAVRFGLLHVLMGIPIGVALALSLGGVVFTRMYLRAYCATPPRDPHPGPGTAAVADRPRPTANDAASPYEVASLRVEDDLDVEVARMEIALAEDEHHRRARTAGVVEAARTHLVYNAIAVSIAALALATTLTH